MLLCNEPTDATAANRPWRRLRDLQKRQIRLHNDTDSASHPVVCKESSHELPAAWGLLFQSRVPRRPNSSEQDYQPHSYHSPVAASRWKCLSRMLSILFAPNADCNCANPSSEEASITNIGMSFGNIST